MSVGFTNGWYADERWIRGGTNDFLREPIPVTVFKDKKNRLVDVVLGHLDVVEMAVHVVWLKDGIDNG